MKHTKTMLLRAWFETQKLPNFYACVVYFSLPNFPETCKLVRYHDIVPRDVLLCNRINDHHIKGGMQYDPHIESAEYAICEPRVRKSFQNKSDLYNNMYLIFRTRYFNGHGSSKYLVTGFYEIEKKFDGPESREAPIIHAKSMHFISIKDSIDITEKMDKEQAFRCSFTSNSADWKEDLVSWVNRIGKCENQSSRYIEEINHLKNIFKENEFEGKNYTNCSSCEYSHANNPCPLTWRRYHRKIPPQPANYMRNLTEFYASIAPDDRAPIR